MSHPAKDFLFKNYHDREAPSSNSSTAKSHYDKLNVVAYTYNLSMLEAEDGEFKARLGYIARPCLNTAPPRKKSP
jgi:hypothetical protein